MSLRAAIEAHAPWILACSSGAAHYLLCPQLFPNPEKATEFFGNVVNISGIAVGFLATGQALLCSLNENFVVKTLKKLGSFDNMLRFFTEAICWCLGLALFSLLSYWLDFQKWPTLFSLWLGVLIGAFAATVRILALFTDILHGTDRPKG